MANESPPTMERKKLAELLSTHTYERRTVCLLISCLRRRTPAHLSLSQTDMRYYRITGATYIELPLSRGQRPETCDSYTVLSLYVERAAEEKLTTDDVLRNAVRKLRKRGGIAA